MTPTPIEIVRRLHRALEAGEHGDSLRPLFTEDAFTVEHPNLVKPAGGRSTLAGILSGSTAGAGLLQRQVYDVHHAVDIGSTAIVRLTWTGVIARDVGPFHAGQVLTAHIAQFVETRDGRVASIETFDCYAPLTAPAS